MAMLFQSFCAITICYLCMSMGLMFAWPSSTLKLFESANTTLDRPMEKTELALLGSLPSIGALISTPFTGFLLDSVGRKYSAMGAAIIQVIVWSMIAACNKVEVILTANFISGVGGAVFLVVPVYVSEICHESIRGMMTSGATIFYGFGLLLSYLLGGFVEYITLIYICLSIAVSGVLMLSVMKESPTFLMKKGLPEEAAKSIAFFRYTKVNSKEVVREMDTLRRAFNPNLDDGADASPEKQSMEPTSEPAETLSLWEFIKKSRSTRRAIVITLVLATAAVFQGLVVVQVYAKPLFAEAVPNISPTLCCVLLAVVTVVAGLTAAYLTDSAGRRPLMIYSSGAAGLCCVLLGTQVHFHWGPHWLTAVLIYLFCTAYTFGAGTVPLVLVAEAFLPEVKSFMTMLVFEWAWLCNFVILFIFNPLVAALGLGPVFYFFAVVCFLTTAFSAIYQPETKGMPVDIIQVHLLGKRVRKDRV